MNKIATHKAPEAIGPYSQAIQTGNLLFVSGQIPLDPETMTITGTAIEAQTEQVINNLRAILQEAGMTLNNVVKTTVFLKDMNDFVAMNNVYSQQFGDHKPARAAVQVARLPKDCLVEIECIAVQE